MRIHVQGDAGDGFKRSDVLSVESPATQTQKDDKLAAWATSLQGSLEDQEAERVVDSNEDPAVASFAHHATRAQFLQRAMRRAFQVFKDEDNEFKELMRVARFLDHFTDAQLRTGLSITQPQVNTLRTRIDLLKQIRIDSVAAGVDIQ